MFVKIITSDCMIPTRPSLLLLLNLLFVQNIFAQDAVTIKDAQEIKYKAEPLVKREFRDLLNNIANSDIELTETKQIIVNAHSGMRNNIFYSPKVQLEEDINPNFHSSNSSRDIEVDKYLNDFDLLYKKSDAPSISFNDVKASSIKKGKNLYVKVYFSSFFRNPNKTNDTAYTLNNRVAEIRFEKEKGKWVPYTARVVFFNPADISNDLSNDIVLLREPGKASSEINNATDSAVAALARQNFDLAQKEYGCREAIEEDRKKTQFFNDLVSKGDKALDINDFTGALKFYKEAKDSRPYDALPQSKINNANKAKEWATITAVHLDEQYLHKAILAENKREPQAAIGFYNDAIDQKPDEAAKYQNKKRELTEKFRVTSELDEKYKAGLYKEAIKEYNAAIKKNKTNAEFYLGRAKCYEKMNEMSKAMKDYTQFYDLDNNNLEAIEKRAALYRKNGNNFKSLTDYKTYLTISKENTAVYEQMAELHMLINTNTDDAIKDFNDGLAIDSKVTNLYIKRGLLLLQKNEWHGADDNFSAVIKLDSNHALAHYYRGKSQVLMNHAETSGTAFDAARQKGLDAENIRNIEAYAAAYFQRSIVKFTKGKAYQDKKNFQNAAICFDNCTRLDTAAAMPDAVYYRGYNNYQLQNYAAAINDYDKIYPAYSHTAGNSLNNEIGNIYHNLRKSDDAYEYYYRAFVKDPDNGLALYGMASALLQNGKTDDALIWCEKAFQTKKVNYNDIKKDNLIVAIKDDKRFKALVKKYY